MTKSQLRVYAKSHNISIAEAKRLDGAGEISISLILSDDEKRKVFNAVMNRITPTGKNCWDVAHATSEELTSRGIDNSIKVGFVVWRIAPRNEDYSDIDTGLISYDFSMCKSNGTGGLSYHAWVETIDEIVDFTTNTIHIYADTLEQIDNIPTPVVWSQDYLWERKRNNKTHKEIHTKYLNTPTFHYDPIVNITATSNREQCLVQVHNLAHQRHAEHFGVDL